MRPLSEAEEARLIAMYAIRAKRHRVDLSDVREIGFALQRPPEDVIAAIFDLQGRGRIASDRPHQLGRRPRSRRQVTEPRFALAGRRGSYKYTAAR
jgi:hypothetical protein